MKKHRIPAIIMAAAVTVSLMGGCTSQGNTKPSNSAAVDDKAPVTISIGDWPTKESSTYSIFQGYLATMKEKYPYITIKPDEYKYTADTFLPKAASGQLPTYFTTWYTEANKIINAKYAANITSVVKKYGYDTAITPSLLKLVTKSNKIYGLPISANSMGLWYNIALWKQAGLVDSNGVPKYPATYDELAKDCQIIKQKTGKPGFYLLSSSNQGGWEFMNIAWSFGASFEVENNGKYKAEFNSPQAVSALQFVKDLKWKYNCIQDNLIASQPDILTAIGTDQAATAFGLYEWTQSLITKTHMSKDNLSMSQVPAGPKGQYAAMGGTLGMFSPSATTNQIDAVFKYLAVTGYTPKMDDSSKAALTQTAQSKAKLGAPVGPTGVQVWADKTYQQQQDQILKQEKNVNLALWDNYSNNASKNIKPEEPINAQELYKALDTVIQKVLTDKNADCQALLDKAASTFQSNYLEAANSNS